MNKLLRRSLKYLKHTVNSNSRLRSLLYDDANVKQFADLDYHEVMLADQARVDTYHEAIKQAVRPGDVVIDLGTGTGILAMLAAKQGAKKVYAIEHGPVVELARKVAAANGLNNIEFVNVNSRDFNPPELADLLIHEQIGSYLFDENMVENILDLKGRALKSSGKILPAQFKFFVEAVSLRQDHKVPYCWEAPIHGIDYSVLKTKEIDREHRKGGGRRIMPTGSIEYYACRPESLFDFDLNLMTADDIPRTFKVTRPAVRDGGVDGLSVFFQARFDCDRAIDNALDSPNTNWPNPLFRVPMQAIKKGDQLTWSLTMGNLRDQTTWKAELCVAK